MQIYIDTVIIEEISKADSTGLISGVTTTPTFLARDGFKDPISYYKKIRENYSGDLQVEAMGSDVNEIKKTINDIEKAELQNITYKMPIDWNGIKILKDLSNKHKFNLHLVYNLNQAMIAALNGASIVCPLMGRFDDSGGDSYKLLSEIKNCFLKYNLNTRIMASSIRNNLHVENAFKSQSDIITIPPKIFWSLLDSSLTEDGIKKFEIDLKKINI